MSPVPKVRAKHAVDVVVSPEINLDQLAKLFESLSKMAGCRACGLLGIDVRLIASDPAPFEAEGIDRLPGVQSAVLSQH